MANHVNQVQGAQLLALNRCTLVIEERVKRDELPQYPIFVVNLMKAFDDVTDEMMHAAIGMSGEAGEVSEICKKVWAYNKPLDPETVAKLVKELGDLRFYYQAMLNFLGLEDRDIIAGNMDKLSERYKSGTYSDAQANARADEKPAPGAGRKFMGQTVAPTAPPMDTAEQARVDAMRKRIADTNTEAEKAAQ